MTGTLSDLLARQARLYGEKPAFIFLADGERDEQPVSFATLDAHARAMGAAIAAQTQPGDRVLLVIPPGLDYVASLLGCWHAGRVAVPVYPPDPQQPGPLQAVLLAVAEDAGVALVVAPDLLLPLLPPAVAALPRLAPELAHTSWQPPVLAPDTLAVLLYTSGSTGAPKGVMLTHGNLLHNAYAMATGCAVDDRDTLCTWLPPYHSSGLFAGIVLPLYLGATNVTFSPLRFVERPARWLEALSRHGVTLAGSPTFAFDLASRLPVDAVGPLDLSRWRVAVVGGEPVRAEALDRFAERYAAAGFKPTAFYPMFGLTESSMISTGGDAAAAVPRLAASRAGLAEHRFVAPAAPADALTLLGCGRALADLDVRIVADGRAQPDGHVGEIWVAGPSVATGYWGQPALTQATFGARLADAGPFLRTGDFGFQHDGALYVTGRLKELIIIRGLNHYPEDLERTAMRLHPTPATCAAAAFALDRGGEEQLALAVELAGGIQAPGALAWVGALRAAIASAHGVTIAEVAIVEPGALPRTATRKVQRSRCRALVESHQWLTLGLGIDRLVAARPQLAAVQPGDARGLLGELCRLVAEATGQTPDPDAPLAQAGLDSLASVRLATALSSALSRSVPITLFFDGTTPREAAAILSSTAIAHERPVDFAHEAVLSWPGVTARPAPREAQVLLTGATGYLGGYLLVGLLRRQPLDVVCLVRAADAATALRRVLANVESLPGWESAFAARVHVLVGELAAPQLGLAPAVWTELAGAVTAIFHNGASVNFVAPYHTLAPANVTSVRTLIELACVAGGAPLHFVSTVGVFNAAGRHLLPRFQEDCSLERPEQLFGGYAQSKWVAEALLQTARAEGLPVRIYRSGLIGAHTVTGHPNEDDFLCRLIRGCSALGVYPALDIDLDVSPVDFIADAIVHLGCAAWQGSGTVHLVNPAPVSLEGLMQGIVAQGFALRGLPLAEWLAVLTDETPPDNPLFGLIPFLTERLTPQRLTFLELFAQGPCPGFDRSAATRGLAGSGIHCAPTDAALLHTYLRAWQARGLLPQPALAPS